MLKLAAQRQKRADDEARRAAALALARGGKDVSSFASPPASGIQQQHRHQRTAGADDASGANDTAIRERKREREMEREREREREDENVKRHNKRVKAARAAAIKKYGRIDPNDATYWTR